MARQGDLEMGPALQPAVGKVAAAGKLAPAAGAGAGAAAAHAVWARLKTAQVPAGKLQGQVTDSERLAAVMEAAAVLRPVVAAVDMWLLMSSLPAHGRWSKGRNHIHTDSGNWCPGDGKGHTGSWACSLRQEGARAYILHHWEMHLPARLLVEVRGRDLKAGVHRLLGGTAWLLNVCGL
mmetsp:Transcript_23641/g.55118  ORF Transcript_23641/g.55118 Transcript_23641/m.55118 type:complete len:179 (+) Transcript_23641:1110-1646(+)